MVTDRTDDLKSIMSDNATYIQFPPLGSSTSLITVYGDHRVNIQRTIRSIMLLVCLFLLYRKFTILIQTIRLAAIMLVRSGYSRFSLMPCFPPPP